MPFTAFATIVSYLIAAIQLAWGMTTAVDLGSVFFEPGACSLMGGAELSETP